MVKTRTISQHLNYFPSLCQQPVLNPRQNIQMILLRKRGAWRKPKLLVQIPLSQNTVFLILSLKEIQRPLAIFWNANPKVGFGSPHTPSHTHWHRAPIWPIYTTTEKNLTLVTTLININGKAEISWHIRRTSSMKKKTTLK